MDKDSFWQQITDIARHHKQRSQPVEQLSEEKMEQLESNVYEHIDQLFSDSEVTDSEVTDSEVTDSEITDSEVETVTALADVAATTGSSQKSLPEHSNSLWRWLFQDSRVPVFVMATIALLSVGVLAYLFSDNRVPEPLFDIPQSVVAADVDRYIQIPQNGSRALAGSLPSERRIAFLAGVAQADLDLIGDVEQPAAHQVALWYHHSTTDAPVVDALSALKTVQSGVARFSANEQSGFWLKQGYAVEVVHLAAKRSMRDLNASTLIDALQFYKVQALMTDTNDAEPSKSDLKSTHADVSRQYIRNHGNLLDVTPAQLSTPEQLQQIVDVTHDMKVLIQ